MINQDQIEHDEKVVKEMLQTAVGESLVRWLRRKTDFEKPVFSAEDTDGHIARLKDGGRQIVCEVLNLQAQTNHE